MSINFNNFSPYNKFKIENTGPKEICNKRSRRSCDTIGEIVLKESLTIKNPSSKFAFHYRWNQSILLINLWILSVARLPLFFYTENKFHARSSTFGHRKSPKQFLYSTGIKCISSGSNFHKCLIIKHINHKNHKSLSFHVIASSEYDLLTTHTSDNSLASMTSSHRTDINSKGMYFILKYIPLECKIKIFWFLFCHIIAINFLLKICSWIKQPERLKNIHIIREYTGTGIFFDPSVKTEVASALKTEIPF